MHHAVCSKSAVPVDLSPTQSPGDAGEIRTAQEERHQRQLLRETEAVHEAVDRFRQGLEENLMHSRPAVKMVSQYWQRLARAIADEQKLFSLSGKREEKHAPFMLAIDADSLAVLALHSIIESRNWLEGDEDPEEPAEEPLELTGGEAPPPPIASTGQEIGETTEDESDAEGAALTTVIRKLASRCEYHWNTTSQRERDAGLEHCVARYDSRKRNRETLRIRDVLYGLWKETNRDLLFGARLLALAEECEVIRITWGHVQGSRKEAKIIVLNSHFEKAFKISAEECATLTRPFRRPMIAPPRPWGEDLPGGYLVAEENCTLPLVKPNDAGGTAKGVLGTDWTIPLEAVNALQETRWKINGEIYAAMQLLREKYAAGKLGPLKAGQISRLGLTKITDEKPFRYAMDAKCEACQDLRDASEIFFPHQLDYRGRIYAIPATVNPQVDDVGRALLAFAEGQPLDKVGARWLAVHLANSWGRDVTVHPKERNLGKASYKSRVDWVRKNVRSIEACARDPLVHQRWMKADKPWRFLAACFEWSRYRKSPRKFLTHLPVTIDGTCNGLQHIAALRRDRKLAIQTNVVPSAEPKDIYEAVAAELKVVLEREKAAGVPEAGEWLKHVNIDRDVCKAAVMTTPYGVTKMGIAGQLFVADFSAALHIPGHGRLSHRHFKNYDRFENRLIHQRGPASKCLWNLLSRDTRQAMQAQELPSEERCSVAVMDLNRIIEGASIYDPKIFTDRSDETEKLVKTAPKDAADVARLNKLLIQDAFRLEVRKTQGHRWKCCRYLAGTLEECIRKIVDPKDELKSWLQSVAKLRARANEGISWVTPSGFPVGQKAPRIKKHLIRAGQHALVIYQPVEPFKIDKEKQVRKIVPNLIHSLDAAHLMRTVRRLKLDGVNDFGVIHDGYAVHASHVDRLQRFLREEFVAMYSKDLLREFHMQQVFAGTAELPEPPELKDLDIREVLNSLYFFC
jgi:hypothetical protein